MKNYEQYSAEDFIQDEDFRDWVQGRGQQETFWLSFLKKYPEKAGVFRQAERFIQATATADEPLSEREIRSEVQRFLDHTTDRQTADDQQQLSPESEQKGRYRFFSHPTFRYLLAAAAVAGMVLGISWHLSRTPAPISKGGSTSPSANNLLVETTNPTRQPLRVWLSDSSEVVLSPQSHLRYPSQFTDTARVVYLVGEAIFSVNHQKRPFMVVTGEMVTKVLGTRFVVSAYDKNPEMTVQVLSGKVSVYHAEPDRAVGSKEAKGLILTANQAAIFEKSRHYISKSLVANPAVIQKTTVDPEVRYDEIPLPDILHELETSYGIAIQFDEQNFKTCRITATLADETLYEKLDLLCKTVGASYEIVDGQILLSGEGCR